MNPKEDTQIAFGGAIKASPDGLGVIEGYLVRFSDADKRDLVGDYFNADTDYHVEQGYPIVGSNVLLHHGLTEQVGVKAVGKFTKVIKDDVGIFVQALIDERDEYMRGVMEAIRDGRLGVGWSSGALPQSVRIADDHHITSWAIIEGSITHTPAMPLETSIQPLRAALNWLPKDESKGVQTSAHDSVKVDDAIPVTPIVKTTLLKELTDMNPQAIELLKQVLAMLQGEGETVTEDERAKMETVLEEEVAKVGDAPLDEEQVKSIVTAALKAREDRQATMKSAMKQVFDNRKKDAQVNFTTTAHTRTSVKMTDLRYDHMSAGDMALGYEMLATPLKPIGLDPVRAGQLSQDYIRAMAHKIEGEMARSPFADVKDNVAVKMAMPFKANEMDASTVVGQGDEWVGVYYSTSLWEKARYDRLQDKMLSAGMMNVEVPQGAESATIPLEGSDPVAYTKGQAISLDSTGRPPVTANINFFGTGSVSVVPKEVGIATSYTQILEEDAVIAIAAQVNKQLQEKGAETIDQIILNGDTDGTINTNINLIDGTPGTGLSAPYYLNSNGMRKLALVTATAQSRSAAAGLVIADFRLTLQKLPGELRARRNNLLFLIDPDTENTALQLAEIATDAERRQTFGTITSGVLENLYGVPVYMSGFLPLSNATGKVSATPSNNIKGTIIAAYAPYWASVWKRRVIIESVRDILSGTNTYVATMRYAVIARGTNAVGLTYNVGIS